MHSAVEWLERVVCGEERRAGAMLTMAIEDVERVDDHVRGGVGSNSMADCSTGQVQASAVDRTSSTVHVLYM